MKTQEQKIKGVRTAAVIGIVVGALSWLIGGNMGSYSSMYMVVALSCYFTVGMAAAILVHVKNGVLSQTWIKVCSWIGIGLAVLCVLIGNGSSLEMAAVPLWGAWYLIGFSIAILVKVKKPDTAEV